MLLKPPASPKAQAFILCMYRSGWRALGVGFLLFLGAIHLSTSLFHWALGWEMRAGFEYTWAITMSVVMTWYWRLQAKIILGYVATREKFDAEQRILEQAVEIDRLARDPK